MSNIYMNNRWHVTINALSNGLPVLAERCVELSLYIRKDTQYHLAVLSFPVLSTCNSRFQTINTQIPDIPQCIVDGNHPTPVWNN